VPVRMDSSYAYSSIWFSNAIGGAIGDQEKMWKGEGRRTSNADKLPLRMKEGG
jgi:hypothetical protein